MMVLCARIELAASSLPRMRSTTELTQHLCATGFSLTKGLLVAHRCALDTLSFLFKTNGNGWVYSFGGSRCRMARV